MAILNYTTQIDPHKSVSEIQSILGSKGCRSISIDYDEQGKPSAVVFLLKVADSEVWFRLPRNVDGVLAAIKKPKSKVPWAKQNREQAERISWRILKDWVEAQMALVEAGQAQMAEVFLPYATDGNGNTMFQRFLLSNTKQLAAVNE